MNKTISIIVPVYRVEELIRKCVDSLIQQRYEELEIILVDDGSPDNCGSICDEYKKVDSRIKVVHKCNGGLSSARNAGLDIATGDYIGFVDSDDYVHRDMYYNMIRFMNENECNIVECGVNIIRDGKIISYEKKENEVITGEEATLRHLNSKSSNTIPRVAVWSKLYKREFWTNNRFPEGKIHEDYLLTSMALNEAQRVGIINEGLYYHVADNKGSIMNSGFGEKDLYLETQYMSRIDYYKESKASKEIIDIAERKYFETLLSLCWRCHFAGMRNDELRYLSMIKKDIKKIMEHKMDIITKLEFALITACPALYFRLRKQYKGW